MAFPISLSQAEYETLVEFARQGTLYDDGSIKPAPALGLDSWLRTVEVKNNIVRHFLWVQWQEQGAAVPPGARFPEKWPPELRASISLMSRAINRSDVEVLLAMKAREPTSVLVTRDPAAIVGWTELAEYFK